MKESPYKSYDDLPLMLSVPQVAAVLGKIAAYAPGVGGACWKHEDK